MKTKFKQITKVRLPFDRRHPDSSKNYGIHGLDVWFILKGPKGAVQFAVSFSTFLPHVQKELDEKKDFSRKIYGIDVGYHSPKPMYEGQPSMKDCDVSKRGKCYYDGSSLRADEWVQELFSIRGENIEPTLWKKLEEEYEAVFGEKNENAS